MEITHRNRKFQLSCSDTEKHPKQTRRSKTDSHGGRGMPRPGQACLMVNWRWRRCPRCRVVRRASEFTMLEYRLASWQAGEVLRACPGCSYEGRMYMFAVVHERPPQEVAR